MPLPYKLTPREEAEIMPAALSARATAVARSLRGDKALALVASKTVEEIAHPESAAAPAGREMKCSAVRKAAGEPTCACAVVRDGGGNVLTVRQQDGSLALPGGWLLDGEDPQDGAERECREETGFPAVAQRTLLVQEDEDGNLCVAVECFLQGTQGQPDRGEVGDVAWLPERDVLRESKYKGFNAAAFEAARSPVGKATGPMTGADLDAAGKLAPDQGQEGEREVGADTPDNMADARARQTLKGVSPNASPEGNNRDTSRTKDDQFAPRGAEGAVAGGGDPSSMNAAIGGNDLVPRPDESVSKEGHHNQYTDKNPEQQPAAPNPRATPLDKPNAAEVSAWRAAGGAAKLQAGLKSVMGSAIDKIKASPQAFGHFIKHEVGLLKDAGSGIKNAVTGKEVTPGQKAAMRTVALKVAVKLAFAAVGAALPGVGHAVGAALEHAVPHVMEAIAHHIASHAAEHTIEHFVKHAAQEKIGLIFKAGAPGGDDGSSMFASTLLAGIQDAIASMSDKDWDELLSGQAPTDAAEDAQVGAFDPDSPENQPGAANAPPPKASAPPKPPAKPDVSGITSPKPSPKPARAKPVVAGAPAQKSGAPQVPGPDRRVGGTAPGRGYTVREDTPVGYGIAKDARQLAERLRGKSGGLEGRTEGYDAPGQPLPTGKKGDVRTEGYPKGQPGKVFKKTTYQGIPVHVDRPAGFVQTGKDADGKPWKRVYKVDYGFIPGTQGGDGEGLDVFLGPKGRAPDAHWAVQVHKDGQFDEYKVLFGFENAQDAEKAYGEHIPTKYLKAMKSTSVGMVRALLGLEPIEVVKALLADSWEDLLAATSKVAELEDVNKALSGEEVARRMLADATKASVSVHEHIRSTGSKVPEHQRRAPLSGEAPADKPAKKPRGESGLAASASVRRVGADGKPVGSGGHINALSQLAGVHDAGSALHAVGSVVGGILQNRVDAAREKARGSSAAAAKLAAARAKADKDKADKEEQLGEATKEAQAHGQAAADHYDAARRAEEAGDQKAMDRHDEAAAGHAEAANKIAAAVDAARKGGKMEDVHAALESGAKHAAKYGEPPKTHTQADIEGRIAAGEPGPVGSNHPDVDRFVTIDGHAVPITDKAASIDMLSADEMTRPYVPVTPAAEGDGDPAAANQRSVRKVRGEIIHKADATEGDQRYVLGIVLVPEDVDSQGDIYSADEIRKTAHRWMAAFRNIDLQHKVLINHLVEPVESYIAPVDMKIGNRVVKAGTWLLAAHVTDDDIWQKVKNGEITGWSISGLAKRTPVKAL